MALRVVVSENSASMHAPRHRHPENPGRVKKLAEAVRPVAGVEVWRGRADMAEATKLARRIHAAGYLEYLERLARSGYAELDEDTYVTGDSLALAYETLFYSYALALEGRGVAFLVARPPGHHAGKGGKAFGARTNGFCLLNNAAAAVLGFRDRGIRRVAILDFDAHHGNGTMEIFYREPVLHIDLHQDPDTLFPFTGRPGDLGESRGFGYKANFVFWPGTADDSYMRALDLAERLLALFSPDALVVSAGFDAFAGDGLADLRLTEASYYRLGRLIAGLSAPAVVVLEGGYGAGLVKGARAFVEGLAGARAEYEPSASPPEVSRANEKANERVFEAVSRRVSRGAG